MGFDGEFHREFVEDFFGIAVDDEVDGAFLVYATLFAVEELVVGDFGGCGFVLDNGGFVVHLDVGIGVCAALAAHQEGVALGIVAGIGGTFGNFDKPTIGVVAFAGRDAFGDDGGFGVFAEMYHFGACVGLLMVVGDCHGIEFAD